MARLKYLCIAGLILLCGCQKKPLVVSGQILAAGKPASGVVVYAYASANLGLKAEYAALSQPSDELGKFKLELKRGTYYLVARKRRNQAVTGPLVIGDYSGEFPQNPHEVTRSVQLPPWTVTAITSDRADVLTTAAGQLRGRVVSANSKMAYVYVYRAETLDKRGLGYEVAVAVGETGGFDIAVNPGRYVVIARSRHNGQLRGPIAADDWIGELANPVTLGVKEVLELPLITLRNPDALKWEQARQGELTPKTETIIQGKIVDNNKQPLAGVFAFLYAATQTVGKPLAKSNFTLADGRFTIYLTEGGTFYLGARSSLGGPLSPGDWLASFDENPEHMITIATGEARKDVTLVASPFSE